MKTKQDRETILELAKDCGFNFGLRQITCDETAILLLVQRVALIRELAEALPQTGGEHVRV